MKEIKRYSKREVYNNSSIYIQGLWCKSKDVDQLIIDHKAVVETMQKRIDELEAFYSQVDQITGDFDDIKSEYVKRYLQDYLKQVTKFDN